MFVRLFALAAAVFLSACVADRQGGPDAAFANPVLDSDFPDPAVIKAADGSYYAYATQGGGFNIQIARSPDLLKWQHLGDALPQKPRWASRTQDFWAPHAIEDSGRYYLYYSAKPNAALIDERRRLCLAVATGARPEGPFTDSGAPLLCGNGFVNIDPMAYDDPATGKRLLYWGSGFEPIRVRELAPDRLSFAPGSVAVDLIQPVKSDDPNNYERLVEGAWVLRRGEYYYMFYSGDNCCGPKAHYALMVARSKSATGPFQKMAAATGARDSVILEGDGRWIAPGHNAVIEDRRGRYRILYHAVDARHPRTRPTDDINTRRPMLIGTLHWSKGWPRKIVP